MSYPGITQQTLGKAMTKLRSNKPINQAFDFAFSGGVDLYKFGKQSIAKDGGGIVKAAESIYKDGGKWNCGKIAGSAFAASAGARVLSGGGITKDGNGNANLIGVPFV